MKLEAIAGAIDFPPQLWFVAGEKNDPVPDEALVATLGDETTRAIFGEVLRLGPRERRLLLGIAREIEAPRDDRPDRRSPGAVTS